MANLVLIGLLSGALAAGAAPMEHRAQVDHPAGPVDALYRAGVAVTERQVGTTGPGGRASTLQCRWTAGLVVDREARHPSGTALARTVERDGAIEGSRPGWCSTHRAAIREEVARQSDELRGHLVEVAREDAVVLRAELDRLHGAAKTG